ncbi:MAG: PilN domain-containing protein [Desulfobacterales bacterium]|nr:PilN domain-containing protein [Desulfobacterales bacterium]
MSRKIIGLDIRADVLCAVSVRNSFKGNWIDACEFVEISKEIENGFEVALKTMMDKLDFSSAYCIASFPADQISYRNVTIPFGDPKKIRQVLPFELEPMLPFQIDTMLVDFHTNKTPEQTNTDIIAASIEKSKFSLYISVLQSLKIEPEIITIAGYTTALCLINLTDLPDKVLFVDIENKNCTIFVIMNRQISLIRSFPVSDNPTLKVESISKNIKRTISAFEETLSNEIQIDIVIITGHGLGDQSFEHEMTKSLELPVERLDGIRDINLIIHNTKASAWVPEKMDNALALSCTEIANISTINFRRGEFAPKTQWALYKKDFIKIAAMFLVVLVLMFSNLIISTYTMEKTLKNLKNQIYTTFRTSFPEVKNIVDPIQQMKLKIEENKKKSLLPIESETNIKSIDILQVISVYIPIVIDVDMDRLVSGPENVIISGSTDTFNSVNDIKNRLEQADMFKKVTITNADQSGNRVNFKLTIDLKI